MLSKLKRVLSNIRAIKDYPEIRIKLAKDRNLYFFFPFWSVGGGERVQLDIMRLFKDQNPLCMITERSENDGFRKEFEALSEVINLGRWGEKKVYRRHLQKKVADAINKQQSPVVFGWCSTFMYDLIPLLSSHVRIIDLTHNFTDHGNGIELYSVPYLSRIEKRVVVNQELWHSYKKLYEANNVPDAYIERLVVIRNKVQFDNLFQKKDYESTLKVLFVARNSPEKRPDLFLKIARLSEQKNLPLEFRMIGNFENYQNVIPANTSVIGQINSIELMNEEYKKAHFLLLTSITESWGLVIFESMNFGVIPISTNVGELSSHISAEKQNGVIIENSLDEDHLAIRFVEQLTRFISKRQDLNQFSEQAFETVRQLHDAADFDKKYQSIIKG